MVARVKSVAFQGIRVVSVDVQVQVSSGLPAFTIVGLPDKAVAESRERVRAALHSIGLALPPKRLTINLSPADIQKEGSHYDLPIALGLLSAMGAIPSDALEGCIALGELALDGGLSSVIGVLPAALEAMKQGKTLICPASCGSEAAWAKNLDVLAPTNLIALVNHFKGTQVLSPPEPIVEKPVTPPGDLKDIKGQESAKRALEVAAAGGHNFLMMGPPGSGKSMLASRLPSILPELAPQESLDVTIIHSLAGKLQKGRLLRQRPFRSPHHSASLPALVGGGAKANPGEISLAHRGVIFLDELPEFSRGALEALRQPLENGKISISRANAHVDYPAQVQMVAAMNPCRCGYLSDASRACSRAPKCGRDYQSRISGPLLDRMDIAIEVPAVNPLDLTQAPSGDSSSIVRERVLHAREKQRHRYETVENVHTNSEADGEVLKEVATPNEEGQKLLEKAVLQLKLSARGYHRILRVARTIADLDHKSQVQASHIGEAISYRRLFG
ncbi:MAG: YifB family Mg chelatase-like AAA ATPase [bacterium]|nr:YifB family Mg chelatase-like AAA ATPase [bacterium]